ncbi:oligosaccharide flippase family protein [Algoriphagus lutimaris]|uniref:oligosaccharide flippase family protein n=1 Tax=Algoriphagus lutimaris TaxID=613197 RepID=UPI00196ACB0B|nr:oligosaccharide flippase family protein [Algoriphagus lutimaris]MBN3518823.1 oligosaccharide flippase family protein [Algoriphagus lutimaris]
MQKIKTYFYPLLTRLSLSERELFKGTVWNICGNGFGKFSLLISAIFVARILGPESFGKWSIIRSTSSIFTILLGFGVGVTAIKYVAEYKDSFKNKAGEILGITITFAAILGLTLSIVFFLLSRFIAVDILKDASLINPLQISSIFLFLIACNGVLSGSLAGFNSFSSIAVANFIGGVLGTIVIISFSEKYGLIGLVSGYVLYYLFIFFLLIFFFLKKVKQYNIRIRLQNYQDNLSVIFNHNLPAILSGGIGGFVIWCVFTYVSRLNNGFSIIGINNAAKIAQNAIMELAAQVDIPIISYLSASKENNQQNLINFLSPVLIGVILILPFIYFPNIISFFFKSSEYDTNDFLLVISLAMLTTFIMIFKRGMGRSIITKNLLWWGVYENILWSLLLIFFTVLFVFDYGSVGLAAAFAFAYYIDLLVIAPFYYRKKLIPKTLYFSIEYLLLWIVVFGGCFMVFLETSVLIRVIVYIISVPIQFFVLYRFYKNI